MSSVEWYQQPYPGAPMVPVLGFPRPLYPPDAAQHDKTPSSPGPDVEAYKRTVSRAGRWPWQAFDEQFSNAFSHGKPPGYVSDSGIAGVQRQQHLDQTGWLGQNTFNTLRSIIIPSPLPHAGAPAMDSVAQDLINEAWDIFQGHEPTPPPPPSTSIRQSALSRARSQIGITE